MFNSARIGSPLKAVNTVNFLLPHPHSSFDYVILGQSGHEAPFKTSRLQHADIFGFHTTHAEFCSSRAASIFRFG